MNDLYKKRGFWIALFVIVAIVVGVVMFNRSNGIGKSETNVETSTDKSATTEVEALDEQNGESIQATPGETPTWGPTPHPGTLEPTPKIGEDYQSLTAHEWMRIDKNNDRVFIDCRDADFTYALTWKLAGVYSVAQATLNQRLQCPIGQG